MTKRQEPIVALIKWVNTHALLQAHSLSHSLTCYLLDAQNPIFSMKRRHNLEKSNLSDSLNCNSKYAWTTSLPKNSIAFSASLDVRGSVILYATKGKIGPRPLLTTLSEVGIAGFAVLLCPSPISFPLRDTISLLMGWCLRFFRSSKKLDSIRSVAARSWKLAPGDRYFCRTDMIVSRHLSFGVKQHSAMAALTRTSTLAFDCKSLRA